MVKSWATDKRVVIESVSPQVDGGKFPAKSTIGDVLEVEADVFADGHDTVRCVLRYQAPGERGWVETPMRSLGNDRWLARFTPDRLGVWQFEIGGWVDQFETWLSGIVKKDQAGVDVSVELQSGAELYLGAARRAKGEEARSLTSIANTVGDASLPAGERFDLATEDESVALARAHPDRSRETRSGQRWPVVIDREKAAFSTWYELFPRSWSGGEGEHGTFSDVEGQLGYVADMGIDVH